MRSLFHARSRTTKALAATAAIVASASLALTVPGVADAVVSRTVASAPSVPAPPAVPTSADQIQNIDQVKTAIKGYYGDTTTTKVDPVDGSKVLHEPSADGNWVKETNGVGRNIRAFLERKNKNHNSHAKKKVLLLDVDDTSLVTYDYEIYTNFVYNPATNAQFVNAAVFPAVPGILRSAQYAKGHGYTVIYLTGRPESQRAGTLLNLSKEGFPVASKNLYLNDATAPYLSSCEPSCTTTQRKSLTRQYIESQGYKITANVGDQFSDLNGGFSKKTFKLPNPMYYLP